MRFGVRTGKPPDSGESSCGKDDNTAHRTRARDPVLHRNRRQPCRCWHHRARNADLHDRESGAYALTDSGRAALLAILGDAGLT